MKTKLATAWYRVLPYARSFLIFFFLGLALWRYVHGEAALAAFDVAAATFLKVSLLAERPIIVNMFTVDSDETVEDLRRHNGYL